MSKPYKMTPARFRKLVKIAEQGGSRADAFKALGITRTTLLAVCKRENLMSWLDEHIPKKQGFAGSPYAGQDQRSKVDGGEIHWLKPEQVAHLPLNVDRTLPHVKAATMKWRAAA
ncbi:hypothetical protein [Marinobacter sp.]|uniref:hypothetical protein n=1 Tax=Marinobacter sp. TaxID=50741 RepID=UPI003A8F5539